MKKKDIELDLKIKTKEDKKIVEPIELSEQEKGIVIHLSQKGYTLRLIVAEVNEFRRLMKSQGHEVSSKAVTLKGFSLYLDTNKNFRDDLIYEEAKSDYVRSIEQAMYELATGVVTWCDQYVAVSDGPEAGAHLECTRTYKKERPDFSAIKFILTNVAPQKWKEKHTIEMSEVEKLSDEDLAKMATEFIKQKQKKKK